MSKLSIEEQTRVINVLRELDAAAKAMSDAIEKLNNLAKEDFIRDPYLATVAEIAAPTTISPDALEVLVPSLTDIAEIAEDIGISPASITGLRFDLRELEDDGFQSDQDYEIIDGDEDKDESEDQS